MIISSISHTSTVTVKPYCGVAAETVAKLLVEQIKSMFYVFLFNIFF